MLEAKRARIKVENDREALANRISRLQMEEVRATKRIEQTHKRTQQILAAKDRHLQSQSQKEQMRQEQEQVVQEHRDYLVKVRQERKETALAAKNSHALEREQLVRANRDNHERNREAIAHARAAELNHAMFKRNEVRRVRARHRVAPTRASDVSRAKRWPPAGTCRLVPPRARDRCHAQARIAVQVEADARERKLREKELMIAHLQQRAEERQGEEARRAEDLDRKLADLERQEYDLLVALEGHKVRARPCSALRCPHSTLPAPCAAP